MCIKKVAGHGRGTRTHQRLCPLLQLKCDAKQTSPHPCTRCVKTNTPCYVDPSFKRTARRQAASNHAPAPSRAGTFTTQSYSGKPTDARLAGFLPPSDVPQAREPAQLPPPSISHMTLERGGEFSVGAVHVTAIQASMLFGECVQTSFTLQSALRRHRSASEELIGGK